MGSPQKNTAILLLIVLFIAPFGTLIPFLTVEGVPQNASIDLEISFSPCIDEYNQQTMNPDGSFYPGDCFFINYDVETGVNVGFSRVQVFCDESIFEGEFELEEQTGQTIFIVRKSAPPGERRLTLIAHGVYRKDYGDKPPDTLVASQGGGVVEGIYSLTNPPPVQIPTIGGHDPPPSVQYTFSPYGLSGNITGTVLTVDGVDYSYERLPVTLNFAPGSEHSFEWKSEVHSESVDFTLRNVRATENVADREGNTINVVEYDPHFSVLLVYTIPKSPEKNSFEKPIAVIVRYDGNGLECKLGQRAVVEGFTYYGYATKTLGEEDIEEALEDMIGGFEPPDVLSELKPVLFSAVGLDASASGMVLTVDGNNYYYADLPKTFKWSVGEEHVFSWTRSIPVSGREDWFGWQYTYGLPFSLPQNQTETSMFSSSPSGTITVQIFGNNIIAFYSYNRLLENPTTCTTEMPVYFTNESRYMKFRFDLNDEVTSSVLEENFTDIYVEARAFTDRFSEGRKCVFSANHTCTYEEFENPIEIAAYKWSSIHEGWEVDYDVEFHAVFTPSTNLTEMEVWGAVLGNQTVDEEALRLMEEDLYECPPQSFTGTGIMEGVLEKTAPVLFNMSVAAEKGEEQLTIKRMVYIPFSGEPYRVFLNLDSSSPLWVNVTRDDSKHTTFLIRAPPELGGLVRMTVYVVTNIPSGFSVEDTPVDELEMEPIRTIDFVVPPVEGSVVTSEFGVPGFYGECEVEVMKDPSVVALQGNTSFLVVEVENAWGIKLYKVVAVEQYSETPTEMVIDELAYYLFWLVAAAIIINMVIFLVKGGWLPI